MLVDGEVWRRGVIWVWMECGLRRGGRLWGVCVDGLAIG